jgi:hypothetical protein
MPERVPDLTRKLELLRGLGPRRTLNDLAKLFNLSAKTLKWWCRGDAARDPGLVPTKHIATLIAVFADALPPSLSEGDVRALVFGSAENLERAFLAGAPVSLADLINLEGRLDTSSIHTLVPSNLSLVEDDEHDRADLPVLALGERFQLEFRIGHAGNCLVLQNAQQAWGVVRFADGSATAYRPAGSVLVPGDHGDRRHYIWETSSPGIHRFVCFVSPEAFPVSIIQSAHEQKSLDKHVLDDLARYFAARPSHLREIHVLAVRVERQ